MAPYQPSDDFIEKVMSEVRTMAEEQRRQEQWLDSLIGSLPMRCLFLGCACIGTAWNLIRLYQLLAPVVCR